MLTTVNTTVTYTRDLRDALTQRVVTTGASSWYQWSDYDTRGLLWKVSAATTNVKPGTPDVTYTYRPSGALASRLFSGGTTVPLTYTIREQLAKIGDPATTTFPFSAGYSYNANGTISSGDFYSAGSPATNKRYKYDFPTYDALNRLKSADHSSWNGAAWTSTLAYDLAGINYDNAGNLTALQRYRETAKFAILDPDAAATALETTNTNWLVATPPWRHGWQWSPVAGARSPTSSSPTGPSSRCR